MSADLLQTFTILTQNAYRVLGLPASASWAEIQQTAGRMRSVARRGWVRSTPWDLPCLGPIQRSEGTIQNALGRLQEPRQRLRERLFWFFESHDGVAGLTPDALLPTADTWERTRSSPALHDSILLRLAAALAVDPEMKDEPGWESLIDRWILRFTYDDPYWEVFEKAEAGFEVRATDEDIGELLWEADHLFIEPLVAFARQHAVAGDYGTTGRVLRVFQGANMPGQDALVEKVLGPLEDRLERSCEEIARTCWEGIVQDDEHETQNEAVCRAALARYSSELSPLVALVQDTADPDGGLSRRVRAGAADCLRSLAVALTWGEQFTEAEGALLLAKGMATDTKVAPQIEEELAKITKAAESQRRREAETRLRAEEDSRFRAALAGPEVFDVYLPITDRSVRVPRVCVCCLGPAAAEQRLSTSYTTGNTRHELTFEFSVCQECRAHIQGFKRKVWSAGAVAGLSAVLAEGLVAAMAPNWGGWGVFFAALALCTVLAWGAGQLFKLPALPDHHARLLEAVEMSVTDTVNRILRLRFWHGQYASEFARMNGLPVPQVVSVQKPRRDARTVVDAQGTWGVFGIAAVMVAAFGLVIASGLWPPSEARPTTSSGSNSSRTSSPTPSNTVSRQARLEELESRMEASLSEITRLENQIDSMDQQMDLLRRDAEQAQNQGDVFRHDTLADQHNTLLTERNQLYQDYNARVDRYNRWVDEYNNLIRR